MSNPSDTQQALESLRPKRTVGERSFSALKIIAVVALLGWAAYQTDLDPRTLIAKRQNAAEFVFGRSLTEEDRHLALDRAKEMPLAMAEGEAERIVRAQINAGELDPSARFAEIQRVTDELLAKMPEVEKQRMIDGEYARRIDGLRGGFFPPETNPEKVRDYLAALFETIAIASWGTLLSVFFAVPASLLAAENTLSILAPGDSRLHRGIRWFSRFVVRRSLDACRGFNEFVLALIFVAVVGLGPFAGVMALAIHSFGILGKVFSEAIETIDRGEVEGVVSTGAGGAQIVSYAVLPQIMPYAVSQSLLRFETNVRSATILGVCGAGGIGFLISDKIQSYELREVCTMMILIIAAVSVIDLVCGRLMKRFI